MLAYNINKMYECTVKRNTGIQVRIPITRVRGNASNYTYAWTDILVTGTKNYSLRQYKLVYVLEFRMRSDQVV